MIRVSSFSEIGGDHAVNEDVFDVSRATVPPDDAAADLTWVNLVQ